MPARPTLHLDEDLSATAWDDFVTASGGLVFHRSDWLEVLRDTQGAALRRYSIFADRDHGELVGVAPIFVRRFGPFRVGGSPLVVEDTPYMGPVVDDALLTHAMVALRDGIRSDASFVRMLLPRAVSASSCRALEAEGFVVTTKTTHRLDLSGGAAAAWKRAEGRCRTAVRRAEKAGVEVRRIADADDGPIRDYYRLVEDVYGRQGRRTPNPLEFYLGLWRRLQPLGLLSLITARVNGEDIAGALIAQDDHRAYYLDGASAFEHRKLNATNLVLWKAVEWSAEGGVPEFDFVGSDIPRLARFKASFGGDLVEHSCIEWASSTPVRLARDWYGRYGKSIMSRLRRGREARPNAENGLSQ